MWFDLVYDLLFFPCLVAVFSVVLLRLQQFAAGQKSRRSENDLESSGTASGDFLFLDGVVGSETVYDAGSPVDHHEQLPLGTTVKDAPAGDYEQDDEASLIEAERTPLPSCTTTALLYARNLASGLEFPDYSSKGGFDLYSPTFEEKTPALIEQTPEIQETPALVEQTPLLTEEDYASGKAAYAKRQDELRNAQHTGGLDVTDAGERNIIVAAKGTATEGLSDGDVLQVEEATAENSQSSRGDLRKRGGKKRIEIAKHVDLQNPKSTTYRLPDTLGDESSSGIEELGDGSSVEPGSTMSSRGGADSGRSQATFCRGFREDDEEMDPLGDEDDSQFFAHPGCYPSYPAAGFSYVAQSPPVYGIAPLGTPASPQYPACFGPQPPYQALGQPSIGVGNFAGMDITGPPSSSSRMAASPEVHSVPPSSPPVYFYPSSSQDAWASYYQSYGAMHPDAQAWGNMPLQGGPMMGHYSTPVEPRFHPFPRSGPPLTMQKRQRRGIEGKGTADEKSTHAPQQPSTGNAVATSGVHQKKANFADWRANSEDLQSSSSNEDLNHVSACGAAKSSTGIAKTNAPGSTAMQGGRPLGAPGGRTQVKAAARPAFVRQLYYTEDGGDVGLGDDDSDERASGSSKSSIASTEPSPENPPVQHGNSTKGSAAATQHARKIDASSGSSASPGGAPDCVVLQRVDHATVGTAGVVPELHHGHDLSNLPPGAEILQNGRLYIPPLPSAPPAKRKKIEQERVNQITTLMVRHLPCKLTFQELQEALTENGFSEETYDFLYLPQDLINNTNRGYMFINLEDGRLVHKFRATFCRYQFHEKSSKMAHVVNAHLQGFQSLYEHFHRTVVKKHKNCIYMKDTAVQRLYPQNDMPLNEKSDETALGGVGEQHDMETTEVGARNRASGHADTGDHGARTPEVALLDVGTGHAEKIVSQSTTVEASANAVHVGTIPHRMESVKRPGEIRKEDSRVEAAQTA
ncbi:unnamed protein product [Amoebophrya sp. A25]|nr:unnamed protein product [Amoebophrya sp. A25]|eukprot:GSA25T00002337001.1